MWTERTLIHFADNQSVVHWLKLPQSAAISPKLYAASLIVSVAIIPWTNRFSWDIEGTVRLTSPESPHYTDNQTNSLCGFIMLSKQYDPAAIYHISAIYLLSFSTSQSLSGFILSQLLNLRCVNVLQQNKKSKTIRVGSDSETVTILSIAIISWWRLNCIYLSIIAFRILLITPN